MPMPAFSPVHTTTWITSLEGKKNLADISDESRIENKRKQLFSTVAEEKN